jgi:hypothetical protein
VSPALLSPLYAGNRVRLTYEAARSEPDSVAWSISDETSAFDDPRSQHDDDYLDMLLDSGYEVLQRDADGKRHVRPYIQHEDGSAPPPPKLRALHRVEACA